MGSLEQYLCSHADIQDFLKSHEESEWHHVLLTAVLYGIYSLQKSHSLPITFQLIHEEMIRASKQLAIPAIKLQLEVLKDGINDIETKLNRGLRRSSSLALRTGNPAGECKGNSKAVQVKRVMGHSKRNEKEKCMQVTGQGPSHKKNSKSLIGSKKDWVPWSGDYTNTFKKPPIPKHRYSNSSIGGYVPTTKRIIEPKLKRRGSNREISYTGSSISSYLNSERVTDSYKRDFIKFLEREGRVSSSSNQWASDYSINSHLSATQKNN